MAKMTLQERVEMASTENLKACALGLYVNEENAAGDALDAVLTELGLRMSETEFEAFCDSFDSL